MKYSTFFKEPLINKLDIFGFNFNFLIHERDFQKSGLGSIFTITYIFIVLSLFIGFGADMYLRKSPKVSFSSNTGEHQKFHLSNTNFTFAYRIEDEDGLIIEDDSIIYLEVNNYLYLNENGIWSLKYRNNTKLKKCVDFPEAKQKEQIFNVSLQSWYCVDYDNITLGGDWDGNFLYGQQFIAKQCINSTTRNNCATKEKIKDQFDVKTNTYLSLMYLDIMPAMNDYIKPLKTSLKNTYEVLDLNLLKKNAHHFKITHMDDDKGWLLPEIEKSDVYSSDSIFRDIVLKDIWNSEILMTHDVYFSRKFENYNRSFTKIQEVIASIGGFSTFFLKVISLFFGLFRNVNRNIFLINNLFFDLEEEAESEIKNKNILEHLELNNFRNSNVIVSDKIKHSPDSTDDETHLPNKIKKLKVSDYFINKFCKKSKFNQNQKNVKIFSKFIFFDNYMKNVMNILTYFNLYKEFENLKKLILNQKEIKYLRMNKPKLENEIYVNSENLIKDFNYFENIPVKNIVDIQASSLTEKVNDNDDSKRELKLKDKEGRNYFTN